MGISIVRERLRNRAQNEWGPGGGAPGSSGVLYIFRTVWWAYFFYTCIHLGRGLDEHSLSPSFSSFSRFFFFLCQKVGGGGTCPPPAPPLPPPLSLIPCWLAGGMGTVGWGGEAESDRERRCALARTHRTGSCSRCLHCQTETERD